MPCFIFPRMLSSAPRSQTFSSASSLSSRDRLGALTVPASCEEGIDGNVFRLCKRTKERCFLWPREFAALSMILEPKDLLNRRDTLSETDPRKRRRLYISSRVHNWGLTPSTIGRRLACGSRAATAGSPTLLFPGLLSVHRKRLQFLFQPHQVFQFNLVFH